jgi:protein-S-isoprenylcysteine O-methyltransferase Ste14
LNKGKGEMKKINMLPTGYLLIALVLIILSHFITPLAKLFFTPWNLVGLIPLCFGIWINLSADRAFHQAGTTVKPSEEPSTLVTTGVFSISRNPMYLGFVAILVGIALLLGTLSPYLIVIAFAVLMDRMFITLEEKNLERKFSSTWMKYKQKVRRWI